MSRKGPRDEEGAASSALLVLALITALAAFVMIALPYGDAADARAGSRTAADAAALAGAEQARQGVFAAIGHHGWPPGWGSLGSPPGWGAPAGWGLGQASYYANANGATLIGPSGFNLATGEFTATVEGREVGDEQARSRAVARLQLPNCQSPEDPEVPELEDPEDPEDLDDPPSFDPIMISCDGLSAPLRLQPVLVDGQFRFEPTDSAWGLLEQAVAVRLVE